MAWYLLAQTYRCSYVWSKRYDQQDSEIWLSNKGTVWTNLVHLKNNLHMSSAWINLWVLLCLSELLTWCSSPQVSKSGGLFTYKCILPELWYTLVWVLFSYEWWQCPPHLPPSLNTTFQQSFELYISCYCAISLSTTKEWGLRNIIQIGNKRYHTSWCTPLSTSLTDMPEDFIWRAVLVRVWMQ